jgi:hypothetical protein
MGLMDVLQPFAKGYLGARVDQMDALAKEKAEQRKFNDQLKATEASNIRQYTAQVRVQDESDARKLLDSSNLIKTDLLNEGMPAQLLDLIPNRHLQSTDTYNDFVTNSYGGDLNWYKKPMDMPDGSAGTVASFTILANQNVNKETDLTSQGGVLEGQKNVANAMLEGDKKEEEPKFADFTNFIAEPEKVQQEVTQMAPPEIDNFIPDVAQPSFTGLGTPTDLFQGYDLRDEENVNQRNKDILAAISPIGGFEEGMVMVDGKPTFKPFTNVSESKRFNALLRMATNESNNFFMREGYSLDSSIATLEAKQKQDFIIDISKFHKTNTLNSNIYPELQQAVDLNVITMSEALEIQLYEDHKLLAEQDVGYDGKLYYKELSGDINPTPVKPEGYDTIGDKIDEAIFGITVDTGLEEEGFDMDGNIIADKQSVTVSKKESSDSWIEQNTVETAKEIGLDNWNKKYREQPKNIFSAVTVDYDSKTGLKKFVNPDLPANHVEPRPGGAVFPKGGYEEWDRLWSETHNEDGTPK